VDALTDAFRTERFELASRRSASEIVAKVRDTASSPPGRTRYTGRLAGERLRGKVQPDRLILSLRVGYGSPLQPRAFVVLDDEAGASTLRCELRPGRVELAFNTGFLAVCLLFILGAVIGTGSPLAVLLLVGFLLLVGALFWIGGYLGAGMRVRLRHVIEDLAGLPPEIGRTTSRERNTS
jgi:hypothetical protein